VAKIIGLTGGIASGKSAVADALRARGAAIVDADLVARQVVEPGQPALADLVARFGSQILGADGRLDRKALGERVFADPAARADLNRITHPRIAAASQAEIARHVQHGAPVVFYEAALLVENRAHEWLDAVIVVAAPPDVQKVRLMARDGPDEAAALARLGAQLPPEDKPKVATWGTGNPRARGPPVAGNERKGTFCSMAVPTPRPNRSPTTLPMEPPMKSNSKAAATRLMLCTAPPMTIRASVSPVFSSASFRRCGYLRLSWNLSASTGSTSWPIS